MRARVAKPKKKKRPDLLSRSASPDKAQRRGQTGSRLVLSQRISPPSPTGSRPGYATPPGLVLVPCLLPVALRGRISPHRAGFFATATAAAGSPFWTGVEAIAIAIAFHHHHRRRGRNFWSQAPRQPTGLCSVPTLVIGSACYSYSLSFSICIHIIACIGAGLRSSTKSGSRARHSC
ncbi:hypothetical protein V8C37DRAFT_222858 [Trichoderma ceciliae]